jgi:hypothetical protein
MKRIGYLFEQVCDLPSIEDAAHCAFRATRENSDNRGPSI